jgi:hypothetical protein
VGPAALTEPIIRIGFGGAPELAEGDSRGEEEDNIGDEEGKKEELGLVGVGGELSSSEDEDIDKGAAVKSIDEPSPLSLKLFFSLTL